MGVMRLNTLRDLFSEEVQDLYDAKQQVLEIMPSMIRAATSEQLKQAFENHQDEIYEQLIRLEKLCAQLDIAVEGKQCVGMEGIIEEGVELIGDNVASPVLDAALIGIAQRIEHYEIAAYGCAAAYAKQLGFDSVVGLLKQTLSEEEASDKKLTELAETLINPEAVKNAFDKT